MTFFKKKFNHLLIVLLCAGFASNGLYAAGTMRNMTSMEIVSDMKVGWNLGNTLDAYSSLATGLNTETCWGNPKTTKAMIDAVKAKGFKTVRIPVTWNNHFGASPAYTIDSIWLNRVQDVVDYAIDDSMYVILNSHHDEWVTLTSSTQTEVTKKLTAIWAQIADRFKNYSDYLVFETLNEPRLYGDATEWTGGTSDARTILNAYNLAVVNTIRNSGGNNSLRHIMIPTHGASPLADALNGLVIPNSDSRVIVSIHDYWTYYFAMDTAKATSTDKWGTAADKAACDAELDRIYKKFVKNNIPVIIGEWGTVNKSNTSARAVHAGYYANGIRERGMLPVWWDNGVSTGYGAFGILNRKSCTWDFPEIVDSLIKGVQDASPVVKTNRKKDVAGGLVVSSGFAEYSLAKASDVSLDLYDMQGKNVAHIVKAYQSAGAHKIKLPVSGIASGNYILEFRSNNVSFTKKIYMPR
jgi:endoglucanase